MKSITESDLRELNDVIVELPAFRDLKSKEQIAEVLNIFTKDIYQERPKELFDTFNSKLSKKMQTTFFQNYGIDSDYADRLSGYVKSDIAYQLEKLFQNKGSTGIFKLLATILESIFPRINFYTIEVQKQEDDKGVFKFKYVLEPLYIQDEDHVLKVPEVSVDKTRKYLMDLINYEGYTAWPVPTNLVYIQFSVGVDIINNLDTFLGGIRGYGTTYLSGMYFNYLSDAGPIEKLEGADMELLVSFMHLNVLKTLNPNWNMWTNSSVGSYLSMFRGGAFDRLLDETDEDYNKRIQLREEERCNFLQNTAVLLKDYSKANYANRDDMEALRRRWQMFLRQQETTDVCYSGLSDLNNKIKEKYPRFYEDFWTDISLTYKDAIANNSSSPEEEGIFSFFLKIYSIFLNGANSSFNQPRNKKCFTEYVDPKPIVSYTWRVGDGTVVSTTPEVTYTPTKIGNTTLTLTVENEDGFVDSDTVTITTVEDGSPSPSVSLEKDTIVQVESMITVRGSAETLSGNLIEGYEFILDGDVIKTSIGLEPHYTPTRIKNVNVTFGVSKIKDYLLELKVWDTTGQFNSNRMTVRSIKEPTPIETYPRAFSGPNLRAILGHPIDIVGSGVDATVSELHNTDWVISYIDVTFGSLFLNQNFMNLYFNPIMDLFERYFLPVELDYIADLTNREKIKDKWNSISTAEKVNAAPIVPQTSIQYPMRGPDITNLYLRPGKKYSYITNADFATYMTFTTADPTLIGKTIVST